MAVPSELALQRGVSVSAAVGTQEPDGSVSVTVTVRGGAALLVVLTTAAQGRFSDNAVPVLEPGSHGFSFLPMLPGGGGPAIDPGLLASSLRVEHLSMYL